MDEREVIEQLEMSDATKEILREILAQNRMALEQNRMALRILCHPMWRITKADCMRSDA